jgi:hypothetical protein
MDVRIPWVVKEFTSRPRARPYIKHRLAAGSPEPLSLGRKANSFSCPFFGFFDKEREDRKKRRKKL